MNLRLQSDNLLNIGLVAAVWIVLIASDGLARGTFVFGAFLGFLASMVVALGALASLAIGKWSLTKYHLVFLAYLAAYSIFIFVRGWAFVWISIAMGAASGLAIFLSLTISRWLGWLR